MFPLISDTDKDFPIIELSSKKNDLLSEEFRFTVSRKTLRLSVAYHPPLNLVESPSHLDLYKRALDFLAKFRCEVVRVGYARMFFIQNEKPVSYITTNFVKASAFPGKLTEEARVQVNYAENIEGTLSNVNTLIVSATMAKQDEAIPGIAFVLDVNTHRTVSVDFTREKFNKYIESAHSLMNKVFTERYIIGENKE